MSSVLLCFPGTRGGVAAGAGLLCLTGILEAVGGMAQYGGLTLPARGGLWDGGSLLTTVAGTSVGGKAIEAAGGCFSAVPDGAE